MKRMALKMILHNRVVTSDLPCQKPSSGRPSSLFTADWIPCPGCSAVLTHVLFRTVLLRSLLTVFNNFYRSWSRELHSKLPKTTLVNRRGFSFVPGNFELAASVIHYCGKYRLNFKC